MMQTFEGYLENGRVYPLGPMDRIQGRRRVMITLLDEPAREEPDTWGELDRIVAGMREKPHFEDFPRCRLGRDAALFEEV